MKIKSLILCILLSLCSNIVLSQKTYNLESPQKNINITISADGDILKYSVTHDNTPIITDSPISMELNDGKILGANPIVRSYDIEKVNESIKSVLYKKETIIDNYNELTLNLKGNYSIQFRAYDDGIAYRFITKFSKPIIVKKENITYNFDDDYTAYIPYVNPSKGHGDNISKQFFNSFENTYSITPISEMENDKLAFMPILISLKDNKKVVITESDLEDYPGTYLTKNKNNKNSIVGMHANYPKVEEQGGYNNLQYIVKEREDYIAKVQGTRDFPWRCMIISENDKELLNNDMVYTLASPSRIEDESWIVPGKVAWEWWNAWNIKDVDFESGINNETYKHYIDFASEYGIEYVILDEGWAVNKEADMFNVIPEIDIYELVEYADNKGVGIVLWAGYYAIERDMEEICKYYSELGIKGFKVDFIDRDDQKAVNFYYKMAETAAKYNLIIDFHGAYKPTGLNRTFPNILNFEGVYGLENLKWNQDIDLVTYETTIPFIRMLAGPLDFTQGAMRNANRDNYRAVWTEPMSQGTRCRQLAMYVVYESPFNMLCDSPTAYEKEPECTEFIAKIPTVWDQTVAIDGKVGEYCVIARRAGDVWYVGGMTNWDERELELDLSFLGNGNYKITEYVDGVNANKIARDFRLTESTLNGRTKKVRMAKGGGFALKIEKM